MSDGTLFDLPAEPAPARDRPLGTRQQTALQLVSQAGKWGTTAAAVGWALHLEAGCRYCTTVLPCMYAASTGSTVLGSLHQRGLIVRRKGGTYHPPDAGTDQADTTTPPPGVPVNVFPDGF